MITQAALARALDLSKQSISKLKKQGMPVDSIQAAQAWREARQNVAARKPSPVRAAPPAAAQAPETARPAFISTLPPLDPPDWGNEPDEDRDRARTRREIADANKAEMEEAKMRREQIRVQAVETMLATDFATTRDALMQIPARLAPLFAADSDPVSIQNSLEAEIHQALINLSGAAEQLTRLEGAFD